ncbi:putative oxidation resistance protein 1-like isoform X1 [Capsicum annuum]|nr:putative oxidation resistance protein 1-like isoform X1 [Capsicum annuum]
MIAEKIVKSGGGKKDNYLQLDAVQNELRKMLDGKKYLLVLDDVWNEDPLKWSRLKNMLIGGARGSKILLTTRSDMVAEVSGSAHQHKLGDLSEEEAWILFEKMAFECNKENENSNLVEIGKEIDFKIGRFDLTTKWIAQGFVQATTSNTDNVEDVANSYFADLLRRSFFQETKEHESLMQFYKMHDLILDLAKEVADRDFFSITKTENTEIVPEQTLCASCLFKIDGSSAFPNSFYRKHMKFRAFIFLNQSSINVLSNSTLERMISRRVRAIGERTPTGVVKRMKHLRQLSVEFEYGNHGDVDTGADLMMLEALQPHQNIEKLRIENYSGSRFPSWLMVENLGILLPKLVHLYIGYLHKIQELPQLWKLPSLQILALRNLGGLEGYDDKFMQPSKTPSDERIFFSSLKQLELQGINEKILKKILYPPPHYPSPLFNLKRLTLHSVEGLVTIPEYVFKNLMSLQSLSIRKCKTLVSLSTCLPHLIAESLYIEDCSMLDLSNEEAMQFQAPGNLSAFRVVWLDKLMSLPLWLRHFSVTLKSINLFSCPNFTTIPE